jgi:hypothetical protein
MELDKLAGFSARCATHHSWEIESSPDIAERLVNHASARTEMEETYNLYTYLPEMREAMERWEIFVQAVCTDACVALQAA